MGKYAIGGIALLLLASIGAGFYLSHRLPPIEPRAEAVAPIPVAPPTTPVAATSPATPKRPDLPTIDVAARPVHAVPDGAPPPARHVTLRTQDGRTIDPESGRAR